MASNAPRSKSHWQSGEATFKTTHWSVVLDARDGKGANASSAMETLCRAYWFPLYAFVRRQGYSPVDAEDLTQGFFTRLLEKDYLATVGREKGRFRSFLLATIKHFMADERDKALALKRGGGQSFVPLDFHQAEDRYRQELSDDFTPEKLYERRWVLTLMSVVFERLEKNYDDAGKHELYQVIQEFLGGDPDSANYAAAAHRLDMSEGAVRVAVHRMRRRYGELFREEVAKTISNESEIEDEIRHIQNVLSG